MTEKSNKNKSLLLGCIADDITGASDLGLMLASNGLPTTLFLGVPDDNVEPATPAVVIALKIRTVPAADAVAEAGRAAKWLLKNAARQLFYKYCSTFDSTAEGNIGPVTDELMAILNTDVTVLLPAFPENGRTVRNGDLYVNGLLLSQSSMRDHPLTPMTKSHIPDLMDAQTIPGSTGLIPLDVVDRGADEITAALEESRANDQRYVCIDTCSDEDLPTIARSIVDLKLITGGSGIASAIPAVLRQRGLLELDVNQTAMPSVAGNAVILAGSCSTATRTQVSEFSASAKAIVVDPIALSNGDTDKASLAAEVVRASVTDNVLVYSAAEPTRLAEVQGLLGIHESAKLVEDTIAYIAKRLLDEGVRKFIVAGGETSGAVAKSLGLNEMTIGEQIDPGVPWMVAKTDPPCCIAFKSGNFGRPDFFQHALDILR